VGIEDLARIWAKAREDTTYEMVRVGLHPEDFRAVARQPEFTADVSLDRDFKGMLWGVLIYTDTRIEPGCAYVVSQLTGPVVGGRGARGVVYALNGGTLINEPPKPRTAWARLLEEDGPV
jgi:hypothetical protein